MSPYRLRAIRALGRPIAYGRYGLWVAYWLANTAPFLTASTPHFTRYDAQIPTSAIRNPPPRKIAFNQSRRAIRLKRPTPKEKMLWQRMLFKGNTKVYAQVDEIGDPLENGYGFVVFRYDNSPDAPTYKTKPRELTPICGAEIIDDSVPSCDDPLELPNAAQMPDRSGKLSGNPIPIPPKTIVVYTDGGASPNPGPAGSGVLLIFEGHMLELWDYLPHSTNNVAELHAVHMALRQIKNKSLPILLYSDSQYAIDVLTGAKKAKKNQDLIAEIQSEMAKCSKLSLLKVRAHVGIAHNEHVDKLVAKARDTKQSGSRRSESQ